MSQCLNPDCLAVNPVTHRFCQKCGQKLWLKDRYQALKLIGQGGFGKTFLAVDLDKPSQPRCVIKQFFPQGQGTGSLGKAAELFQEEAKRLDDLGNHGQIPELLAYFIADDQRQYLVQEYVEGENLAQELESKGVFNEEKIRALLMDLLPVLDFIHSHQVIHRDIKPENIIRRQSDQKLVLVDFGAAKAVEPGKRSVTGTIIGSAEYVAPEQMNGKAVNASDLYSLGVTCLHLLTGISPFDLFDQGEHEWCWRDYLVNNSVSNELCNILEKLVILGMKKRYQSAADALKDLGFITPKVSTQTNVKIPTIPKTKLQSGNTQTLIDILPGGVKLEMIKIPAGSFMMGSNQKDNEKPIHRVTLREFYLGKYPVTQEQ
ncbi:protein kinase [Synechocystis sp. PCC 7339]|nr:protein kinase [Synechocystis sp. PCC 7338]UAJ71874.1 protein kinase [Synechocystis sp. PCC 7339]